MSAYDNWKLASPPEYSGADDEPPICDVDGCGEEGLNAVGSRFVCDEHKPGRVEVGGTPGCAGDAR